MKKRTTGTEDDAPMALHTRQRNSTLGTLSFNTRAVTLVPRLLATRIKHLLRDELYIDVKLRRAPSVVKREIVTLELLSAYHCWLRGVQALLAIVVFALSLLRSNEVLEWTIFGISEATVLIILKVYTIKAEYMGLTNGLDDPCCNVVASHLFPQMLLEVLLWNLHTPPVILFWRPFFELLNYFVFIRLYAVALYVHDAAYMHRSFCRAMVAVLALPLNASFTLRTVLVFRKAKVACLTALLSWFALSCMYAKAEGIPLHDSLWYTFQTITTIGYGDIYPGTSVGRLVTALAWIVSFVLIAYFIVILHVSLAKYEDEHNMSTLTRCHKLSHAIRGDSARVIQAAWRLHRVNCAYRQHSPKLLQRANVLLYSWRLTRRISRLRSVQQDWGDAIRRFRASCVSPATGLSESQHHEQLRHAQRVAQHVQRQIDVEIFVQKFVNNWNTAPTREEVERAIFDNNAGDSNSLCSSDVLCGFIPFPAVDTTNLLKRVEALESVCADLSALIDSLSSTAMTNPPSLAHSRY